MPANDVLVDRIYEAAVVPGLWPGVLDSISQSCGSKGGLLFATNAIYSDWTGSDDIRPLFADFLQSGLVAANERPQRFLAAQHAGFLPDTELFSAEEMERSPFYRFLRRVGLGLATGTVVQAPVGDFLAFSFERSVESGSSGPDHLSALDRLRPHLARSALLAFRIGLERARAKADALQALGLAGGVLDPAGA